MVVNKLKSEQLVTFWTCLFDGLLEPDLCSSAASSVVLNHSLKYRGSECSSQVCVWRVSHYHVPWCCDFNILMPWQCWLSIKRAAGPPTTLVVQVEQSIWCVGVWAITFELNDLWPGYFTCWFTLTVFRSSLKVKVIGHSLLQQEESVAEVIGVTSTEGFLVADHWETVLAW